jgi:hypothetical protein
LEIDDNPEPEFVPMQLAPENQLTFLEGETLIQQLKDNCSSWGMPPEQEVNLECFSRGLQAAKTKKVAKKKHGSLHQFFHKKN